VLVNLAERAETLNYTCPTFTDKPGIRITEGRHPVVEQVLNEPFIANPLSLSPQRRMLIITGPNMGGKSTYMRQTALIALLPISAATFRRKTWRLARSTASLPAWGGGRSGERPLNLYGGDDRNGQHSA
jgi:hypothetical protein